MTSFDFSAIFTIDTKFHEDKDEECNIANICADFTLGDMAYVTSNGVKASAGD